MVDRTEKSEEKNPFARLGEGDVASGAAPRRGSLLHRQLEGCIGHIKRVMQMFALWYATFLNLGTYAITVYESGDIYYKKEDECINGLKELYTIGVSGCNDTVTDLVVPAWKVVQGIDYYHYFEWYTPKVRAISEGALQGRTNLVSVTLPQTIVYIRDHAFKDCVGLTSIDIATNIVYIASSAFAGCKKLSKFDVAPDSKYYSSVNNLLCDKSAQKIVACPCALVNVRIPDSIKEILYESFYGSEVVQLTIPSSVEAIGAYAFSHCTNLCQIVFKGLPPRITGFAGYKQPNDSTGYSFGRSWKGEIGSSTGVYSALHKSDWKAVIDENGYWHGLKMKMEGAPDSYKVMFDKNGGDSVSTESLTRDDGSAIGELPTATRDGYDFAGWFTAAEGGTEISDATVVTGNVTYYAHWTLRKPVTYTIVYNVTEGEGSVASQTCEFGEEVYVDDGGTLHWEGHCFAGWALAPDGDIVYRAGDTVDEPTDGDALKLYAKWSDVVVHFNANGGVFRRSDGTTTNRFDQYFTYGVPQKLFTDELVPLKPDENGNQFLGWVRGTPNVYPDSDIVDGREEKTWNKNDGTEVTYYAVWSYTMKVVFCNSGHDLVPASLADHLKWYVVNVGDSWLRSGDSVQVPPGRQTLFLDYDAAYSWVAGELQIDSSDYYAQYYDSNTRRLTLDIDNDHRNDYYQTVEVGHTFYVKVGPPQGQICNVFFRCAGETIPDQTFDAADVNITLTYYGPSGNDRGVDLPGFSAVEVGKSYYLPYGVYDVRGGSRDGKWFAPTIPRLALAKDHKDVYLNFAYQRGNSPSGSKITLNPCGGTVDPTEIYVYTLEVPQLPMPEHTWREFRGWWTQEGGKGRKVVPGTRLEVGNKTLYAHWETLGGRLRARIWDGGLKLWNSLWNWAVKSSSIDGTTVITLTSDVSGTIEIPDNISALTIDLNGHSIVASGGTPGETNDEPAIRIVKGDGDGGPTRLSIVDTSEGKKGQISGGGESAGIEVAEDTATGLRLDVEEGVSVFNGDGSGQVWTVSFDANGGSGSMARQYIGAGKVAKLNPCAFAAPAGKRFAGWRRKDNGRRYDDGMLVFNLASEDGTVIVLEAVWEDSPR